MFNRSMMFRPKIFHSFAVVQVRQGLDPAMAQALAAQTMAGAGTMAAARHPAILREAGHRIYTESNLLKEYSKSIKCIL